MFKIKHLKKQLLNGIIISGVARFHPILAHIQSLFPIWGCFSGNYGLLCPIVKSDTQDLATILLLAEAKLGELLNIPKKGKTKEYGSTGGTIPTLPSGITKKQSHYAQQLARHPEIIEANYGKQ